MGEHWSFVFEQWLVILIFVAMAVGFWVRWSYFAYFWWPGGLWVDPSWGPQGCCGFVSSLPCGIVSVALYLSGSGAGDLEDGVSIWLGLLVLGRDVSGLFGTLSSDSCFLVPLHLGLDFLFDWSFPLKFRFCGA